jgi:hypothetical protein
MNTASYLGSVTLKGERKQIRQNGKMITAHTPTLQLGEIVPIK